MIKEYIPSYKKAILDLGRKYAVPQGLLELNLKHPKKLVLCYFSPKFKGFAMGAPIDDKKMYLSIVISKNGKDLYKEYIEKSKELGYDELHILRDKNNEKVYKTFKLNREEK